MNRFALLDESDNEETKTSSAASKDKKKKDNKETKPVPAPAADTTKAAPKKDGEPRKKPTGAKSSGDGKPKTPRAAAPVVAEVAVEGDDAGFTTSKGEGRDHQRKQRDSRKDKKDRLNPDAPSIKIDNRHRESAHGGGKGKGKGGGKGKDKNDGPAVVKETEDAEDDAANEVAKDVVEETVEVTPVPAEPEGPATLTLDEYLRQREEARAASAILSAAKAARVVEEDFKGLKIKGEDEEDAGVFTGVSNKTKKEKASAQRSTAKTVLTDLSFKGEEAPTEEPRADRGGDRRSGRGGGRGTPRSGGSTPRARGAKIDFADASAFPKL